MGDEAGAIGEEAGCPADGHPLVTVTVTTERGGFVSAGLLSIGLLAGIEGAGIVFMEEYAGGIDAGGEAVDCFGGGAIEEDLPAPPPPPLLAHLPPEESFTSWQSFWFSTGLV